MKRIPLNLALIKRSFYYCLRWKTCSEQVRSGNLLDFNGEERKNNKFYYELYISEMHREPRK